MVEINSERKIGRRKGNLRRQPATSRFRCSDEHDPSQPRCSVENPADSSIQDAGRARFVLTEKHGVYPFFQVTRGSRKKRKVDGCSFECEELRFSSGPARSRKSAKLPTGCGNAMARDDDRNGILRHGLADFLSGCGLSQGSCNFAISAGLSRRNLPRGFVNLAEKGRSTTQVNGNIAKVLHFALKMLANFLNDFRNLPWRHTVLTCTSFVRDPGLGRLGCRFRKLNSGHDSLRTRSFAPGDSARADRRFKHTVRSFLHAETLPQRHHTHRCLRHAIRYLTLNCSRQNPRKSSVTNRPETPS